MRITRRWQRIISITAITAGLILYVEQAHAGPVHDRLSRELYAIAGEKFEISCTYAAREAYAIAFPRYKNLPPLVYARPEICKAANTYVRTGRVTSAAGRSLLVLVHEAHHIAGVRDEALTECLALRDVPAVAERLHAGTSEAVMQHARYWHAWIVAKHPHYGGASC
jgi:hypothetical protein